MAEPLTLDDLQPQAYDLASDHGMYSYICAKLRGIPTQDGPTVTTTEEERVLLPGSLSHVAAQYAILRRIDAAGWVDPMLGHIAEVEAALNAGLQIKSGSLARLVVDYMRDIVADMCIAVNGITLFRTSIVAFPYVDFPPAPCPINGGVIYLMATSEWRYDLKMTHIAITPERDRYPSIFYRDYDLLGTDPDPLGYLTTHNLMSLSGRCFRAELDVGPMSHFGMCRDVYSTKTVELELSSLRDEDSQIHRYRACLYADDVELSTLDTGFIKIIDFIRGETRSVLTEWINRILPMYKPADEFARQVRQQARRALDAE